MRVTAWIPAFLLLSAAYIGSCNIGVLPDGNGDGDPTDTPCQDLDFDGVCLAEDCNDFSNLVNPGLPETTCDGIDNDCDPELTPDDPDNDGDGISVCTEGTFPGDCDDNDPNVNPLTPELPCDGLDNDCSAATPDMVDNDGDGYICDDCNDSLPSVHPGRSEIGCDGLDNDYDAATPDGADNDGDGYSSCLDCHDGNPAVHPSAVELCADGLDNNCDSLVDCADGLCSAQPNCQGESNCGDGFDNDGDGLSDCSDPDCSPDPACAAGAVCVDDYFIGCGQATSGATGTNGTWGDMNLYSCTNAYADNADEHVYGFSVNSVVNATITLTPIDGDDLNIWLLQGVCDPANCVDYSHLNDPEVVTFTALPGVNYHIVVDGWSFHTGPYALQVTCN